MTRVDLAHVLRSVDGIVANPRGKFTLPNAEWRFKRFRRIVYINCGQGPGNLTSAPYAVPCDLFLEMEAGEIKRWFEDCRRAVTTKT